MATLSIEDIVIGEGDGFVDVVVRLSDVVAQTVSVNYTMSNGTALNGSDYTFSSGSLSFAAGETTKTIRVSLLDGVTPESLEHFFVSLNTPTNATIAKGYAVVEIVDNDSVVDTPQLFVRDVVVDEKAGTASFVVMLGKSGGQSSNSQITVDYTTADSTAAAGSDYVAKSGTLTFAPGESVKTVVVDITDDALAEGLERFTLNLSNAVNATIVKGVGVAEIGANDATAVAQPRISVADVVVGENEGYTDIVVSLSAPGQNAVSVNYTMSNGTAANGSDYNFVSGTLNFAIGETTKTIRVPLVDNVTAEALEHFFISLDTPTNATIAKGYAVVEIVDNDSVVDTPQLFVRDVVVDEKAGTASFVVMLGKSGGQSSNSQITVDYTTADSTAAAGSDYVAKSGTLTFAPGESVKTVVVDITDDALAEGLERFTLNLSNAVNATIVKGVGVAEIGANDATAVAQPRISVADVVVGENEGYTDIVVSLSAPGQNAVSVNYTMSNGTAANGSDYNFVSGTLNFAIGETTKTIRVPLVDNVTAEALEHFFISLDTPTNATIAKGYAVVEIVDNDSVVDTPQLFVRDVVVDEKAGTASFVVMLGKSGGQSSNSQITVDYTTADSTAAAGSDYVAKSGTLTFAPGESVKTVVVDITDDALAEGLERFTLNLSNAVNATIVKGVGVAEIGANDATAVAQPRISVADVVVGENEGYTDIVVSLSAPGQNAVSVNYTMSNGTAANGSDYNFVSGTLNFAIGETTKTIRVPLVDNVTAEALEHFFISLDTPTNATIAKGYAVVEIVDNDSVVDTPQLFVRDVVVDEKAGTASFVVMLGQSGGQSSNSQITVDYTTADSTAAAGSDYVAKSGTLTFAPGESVKTVVVDITDDALAEGLERVNFVLSNAVNAVIVDPNATAVIGASEAAAVPTPVVSAGDFTVSEHDGFVDLVVSLSAPGQNPVSVNYTMSNGTALNGSDYNLVSGTLNFAVGETTETIRVPLVDNLTAEALESFRVNLSAPVNATVGNSFATISIVDDDTPGVDVFSFGISDDVYDIDSLTDVIVENPGGGTDLVRAVISYTLGANLENLRLMGSSPLDGTGNELDNVLYANDADNVLTGNGGVDTVSYLYSSAGVTVSLGVVGAQATGGSGSDTLVGIEALAGSAFNDSLGGSTAADTLSGGAGNDTLDGGAGADSLIGGDGNDTFVVDNAADQAVETNADPGTGGIDTVNTSVSYSLGANVENIRITGAGAINATGNGLANLIFAGAGNNVMDGAGGTDTVSYASAASAVTVSLGIAAAQATGGSGSDTLLNIENLVGSNFNDSLAGDASANALSGGGGDDTLDGGAGDDTLDGGAGTDTASYGSATSGVTVDLSVAGAQATGGSGSDTLVSIEVLVGSAFNDSLSGTAGGDTLKGGAGNDTLSGGAGADVLDGEAGADSLVGGDGSDNYYVDNLSDVIVETNADIATGGTDTVYALVSHTLEANVENLRILATGAANMVGNNANNVVYAGAGNNIMDGLGGTDTVSYVYAVSGVTVTLDSLVAQATGGSGSDTVLRFENLTGSTFADTLTGTGFANALDGGSGADILTGGDGNDNYFVDNAGDTVIETNANVNTGGIDTVYTQISYTLTGNVENLRLVPTTAINGTGNGLDNVIYAGNGNNVMDGGAGSDRVSYAFATSGVTVDLSVAGAQATGGSGSDTLIGIEGLIGSNFNDSLAGTSGNDFLYGGTGVDTLSGGAGADVLDGQAGADSMVGGDGSDNYYIDDALDLTVETNASTATGGIDTAYTNVSHALQANVENARILAAGAVNLTGNALANVIWAGRGDNVIDGQGGSDTVSYTYMLGGVNVSLANAAAQNTLGSGTDTLLSIENIIGTNYADNLTGTAAANVIDGGLGADIMIGGDGSDLYYVDNSADNIIESNANPASGGIDLVYATASYTLQANVENLRQTGAGNINATGNALANTLYAGAGNNVLDGQGGSDTVSFVYATAGVSASLASGTATGGSGADTLINVEHLIGSNFADTLTGNAGANSLTGGTGADTFVLNGLLASDNVTDFASGTDKMSLSQSAIPIGNGDTTVDNATSIGGPGGFATTAELVIVTGNIAGAISATSAAAAIGSATSAYAIGQKVLFVVDNGTASAAYLFTAADANALVSDTELTLLATLSATPATNPGDWLFGG